MADGGWRMADGEVEAEACSDHLPASRAQLHVTPGGTGGIRTEPGSRKEDMFDAVDTRAFELPRPIKACPEVDGALDELALPDPVTGSPDW